MRAVKRFIGGLWKSLLGKMKNMFLWYFGFDDKMFASWEYICGNHTEILEKVNSLRYIGNYWEIS